MIPTRMKIGACTWKIEVTEVEDDEMGSCEYGEHHIRIDKNLSEETQEEVFIHELLHACCYSAGVNEKKMSDEKFISSIAYLLHSTLRQNNFWPRL
jgi:hypothetical protein